MHIFLYKNSRKFIVAISEKPWWKGFLLKRAKDLFKWAQKQLRLDALPSITNGLCQHSNPWPRVYYPNALTPRHDAYISIFSTATQMHTLSFWNFSQWAIWEVHFAVRNNSVQTRKNSALNDYSKHHSLSKIKSSSM